MAKAPNPQLIKELREALALAEQGKLRDGAIIAIGDEISHHGFSVEQGPHRLVSLLGEIGLCTLTLQNMLVVDRMKRAQANAAGVVGGALRT